MVKSVILPQTIDAESTAISENLYARYRRLLPPNLNLDLVLLKGHLLVEEQLERYIEAHSRNVKSLEEARLSFIQKVHLVRALGGSSSDDSRWRFVSDLNTVRNRLVHRLEPGNMATNLDNMLRNYWRDEFERPKSVAQRASRLRQTLALVIAFLAGRADEAAAMNNLHDA